MTTVAQRITEAREAMGLTAYALSKQCDLSTSHVSLIERGLRPRLEIETAIRLARAFGSTTDWLLTGEGEPPECVRVARAKKADGASAETAA